MNNKTYSTKEIAKISGVHANTVRLYEAWGFIAKAARLNNNYRVFNDDHLYQMNLARVALPGPYPLDGKLVQQLVKEFALYNIAGSLVLAREYLNRVDAEKQRALQALAILDQWFEKKTGDKNLIVLTSRKQAAREINVSIDSLRTWERNGLFVIAKDCKGRMAYSEWDLEKIKVIRLLRNCGYSLSSLLRVFADEKNLKEKPSLLMLLPDDNADFCYVTDLYLQFLEQHRERARKLIALIDAFETGG
ncbi:MAG: MerR family transcriptional regulator [Syntrophomonadaceae bacterium]|nr:MerR family transcriptional regulator [Syntrophomonadaceae bacterium]MDD3024555.1 MerR family transcriptional regulator [Syntrophomonadaceae bacterium]